MAGDYGLIPAGAGRTHGQDQGTGAGAAHPRWRGEDHGSVGETMTISGSSPLARGGRSRILGVSLPDGLIPAGAGRTAGGAERALPPRAHPRWRGEDGASPRWSGRRPGSSPLARGGHVGTEQATDRRGLIPAGAGRTRDQCFAPSAEGAHPRWRGEDGRPRPLCGRRRGSSPLARGGLHIIITARQLRRLIPAGAGRTALTAVARPASTAHPRWRGEDPAAGGGRFDRAGSSPLARGGLVDLIDQGDRLRLIPAGAGRTQPVVPGR